MSSNRADAIAAYTRQPGEPAAGFINAPDAIAATNATFDEIEQTAATLQTADAEGAAAAAAALSSAVQALESADAAGAAAAAAALSSAVQALESADAANAEGAAAALSSAVEALESADAANAAGAAAALSAAVQALESADATNAAAAAAALSAAVQSFETHNLLSPNVATGTDTLGTTEGYTPNGCTLASVNGAYQGTRGLQVTATGGVLVVYGDSTSSTNGQIPVRPGHTYTFRFWARSDNSTRAIAARLNWIKATGGLSAITPPQLGATRFLANGWQEWTVTGKAPADAATLGVQLSRVQDFQPGENFITDFWSLTDETFRPPESYLDTSAGSRLMVWDAIGRQYRMAYGDTGWRDVSASLLSGFTTASSDGRVLVRRISNVVYWDIRISGANRTGSNILNIPGGFGPGRTQYVAGTTSAFDATTWRTTYFAPSVWATAQQWATDYNAAHKYVTDQAWPATLPGVAA